MYYAISICASLILIIKNTLWYIFKKSRKSKKTNFEKHYLPPRPKFPISFGPLLLLLTGKLVAGHESASHG